MTLAQREPDLHDEELFEDEAPNAVAAFVKLAEQKYFDGQKWELRYSAKDGLPSEYSAVTAAWDATGRLWVGTVQGLFRLEGERFTEVLSPDGASLGETDTLLADTNGVWVASWGSGAFLWDGTALRPLPGEGGQSVRQTPRVYRDSEGQIYFNSATARATRPPVTIHCRGIA